METRARPTSRGRARCVSVRMGRRWEQTAAGPRAGACRLRRVGRRCLAPVGKGRCRCACSTLFGLRAKALQSGAPDFGVSREKAGFRNASHIRGLSRRAGGRGIGLLPARGGVFPARRNPYALTMSLSPQETEIRPISQSEHPLFPARPSTFIHPWQTRPFSSRVSSPPHFAANIRRTPKPSVPRLLPPFPSPPHPPNHPAGRTAGSARTRPRDQSLGDPFLGSSVRFPPSPVPPKRRRRTAPARGPSAVYALCRRTETKRSTQAPYSWGLGA